MPKKSSKRPKEFADRLIAWRKAKNFGRHAAALHLGVSKRTLQSWEQRNRRPRLDSVEHILIELVKDGF